MLAAVRFAHQIIEQLLRFAFSWDIRDRSENLRAANPLHLVAPSNRILPPARYPHLLTCTPLKEGTFLVAPSTRHSSSEYCSFRW